MNHRIVIPDWLPESGNRYARMHWAVRRRHLADATNQISFRGGNRITIAVLNEQRRISIHLNKGRRGRLDDPGNLDGRSKQIYDALVHLGILYDDDHKHLQHTPVTQTAPSDDKQTIILISEPTNL